MCPHFQDFRKNGEGNLNVYPQIKSSINLFLRQNVNFNTTYAKIDISLLQRSHRTRQTAI